MVTSQRPTTCFRIAWATMMSFRGQPFTRRDFVTRFIADHRAQGAGHRTAWARVGLAELRDQGFVTFNGTAWQSTLPSVRS